MSRNNKLRIKVFFLSLGLLIPFFTFADPLVYELSAPIPGGNDTANGFTQYISFLFPFLLSIAAISALIMFIIGGIQYTLGGASPEQMKSARERISNAIWGLLLAVFSVLILQTINPELIKLSLTLEDVGTQSGTSPNNGNQTGQGTGGNLANGALCSTNDSCASGLCNTSDGSTVSQKICLTTNRTQGTNCIYNEECASHVCLLATLPGSDSVCK